VKTRLSRGEGMSFSEFCYPIMQTWDWLHLFEKGVQVQVGGSDQFGNILLGIDLIKQIVKNRDSLTKNEDPELAKPMGFTTPLLTNSAGEKIGKSAGNAIWLDKDMTSILDLYQVRGVRQRAQSRTILLTEGSTLCAFLMMKLSGI
jgi:tyrosyl-tRNA synthetase